MTDPKGTRTKYIFVTGGVVSGLGKGIAAASLGRVLKERGFRVTLQKFDPYINVDPGTLSPYQHGEVFVTWGTTSVSSTRPCPKPTTSPRGGSTRTSSTRNAGGTTSALPCR